MWPLCWSCSNLASWMHLGCDFEAAEAVILRWKMDYDFAHLTDKKKEKHNLDFGDKKKTVCKKTMTKKLNVISLIIAVWLRVFLVRYNSAFPLLLSPFPLLWVANLAFFIRSATVCTMYKKSMWRRSKQRQASVLWLCRKWESTYVFRRAYCFGINKCSYWNSLINRGSGLKYLMTPSNIHSSYCI